MRIEFKNGSHIKSIDAPENKCSTKKGFDMSDVDWFCTFMGFDLFQWQKVLMWLQCHKEIRRMKNIIGKLEKMKVKDYKLTRYEREVVTRLMEEDGLSFEEAFNSLREM